MYIYISMYIYMYTHMYICVYMRVDRQRKVYEDIHVYEGVYIYVERDACTCRDACVVYDTGFLAGIWTHRGVPLPWTLRERFGVRKLRETLGQEVPIIAGLCKQVQKWLALATFGMGLD